MDPGRASYLAQNRSTTTLVSTWSVTGVAFLVALARLYVRAVMRRNVRNDDYFIILSVAASIASCALTSVAVAHGLGRHVEALSREDQVAVTTWTYIAFCPGVMSFAIPKLAVIALLVRLMAPRKSHYMFLWGMGITVQLTLLATVGILIRVIDKKCPPFNDVRLDPPEHCVPIHVQVRWCLFAGSLSAFVDFYLAIYPSVVLYGLQMRRRKKVALSVALGLGVLLIRKPRSGAVAVYKTTHLPALADPDFTCIEELLPMTTTEGGHIAAAATAGQRAPPDFHSCRGAAEVARRVAMAPNRE
ncbi:Integral membrane protein [Apiospora hydei]|uniref:Integral membrane protein n=1 Tax=Apiospora hydei TaxID=1337664 RepID=A0ABR1V4T2_9PEZI